MAGAQNFELWPKMSKVAGNQKRGAGNQLVIATSRRAPPPDLLSPPLCFGKRGTSLYPVSELAVGCSLGLRCGCDSEEDKMVFAPSGKVCHTFHLARSLASSDVVVLYQQPKMLSTRVFLFLTFLLLSIALLPSSALPSAPLAYRKAAPSSSFARSAQPLKLRGGNADAAGTAPGDEGVAAADASSNPGGLPGELMWFALMLAAPPTAFGEVQSAADREKLENFLEQMGEKTEGQNVSSLQSSYSIYELRESGTLIPRIRSSVLSGSERASAPPRHHGLAHRLAVAR
eukprot:2632521-Rhodomonas_salina.1